MFENPYFGILLSFGAFVLGKKINEKLKSPILNPLLLAIIFCVTFLKVFNISYDTYNIGGQYISFLIGPATVALMVSLYKNIEKLRANLMPILVGIIVGSVVAVSSVFFLCKIFKIDDILTISLLPQSVTNAISVSLVDEFGGSISIGAVAVVIRGVTGAVIAPIIMKIFKVKSPIAKGVGIGTASHAVGTSRALEMGEIEGAMSGLSIALAGIITVIIMPIFAKLV